MNEAHKQREIIPGLTAEERNELQRTVRRSYPASILGLLLWNWPLVMFSLILHKYDVALFVTWLLFGAMASWVICITCSDVHVPGHPDRRMRTPFRVGVLLALQGVVFIAIWLIRFTGFRV